MLFPYRNFLLTAGLVTTLTLNQCYAGQDLDLIASVTNTTCQTQVSDGGTVNLGTVDLNYFPADVTAETEYGGGKTFTIEVTGCSTDAASTTPTQIKMNFIPQSGHLANGNLQVFANDDEQLSTGAKKRRHRHFFNRVRSSALQYSGSGWHFTGDFYHHFGRSYLFDLDILFQDATRG